MAMATLFFFVLGATFLINNVSAVNGLISAADNGIQQFQSSNYPDRYIRHSGFQLYLNPDDGSDLFAADSRFRKVAALNGQSGYYSYESTNYAGRYIRHAGFRLRIDSTDDSDLFRQDASFQEIMALNGENGYVSYESANYPDRVMRHRGFEIWLDAKDTASLFKEDSSFKPGLFESNYCWQGTGGCHEHFEDAPFTDHTGTLSLDDCAAKCDELECTSFSHGKLGVDRENWCNVYFVECTSAGDSDWNNYLPSSDDRCNGAHEYKLVQTGGLKSVFGDFSVMHPSRGMYLMIGSVVLLSLAILFYSTFITPKWTKINRAECAPLLQSQIPTNAL